MKKAPRSFTPTICGVYGGYLVCFCVSGNQSGALFLVLVCFNGIHVCAILVFLHGLGWYCVAMGRVVLLIWVG